MIGGLVTIGGLGAIGYYSIRPEAPPALRAVAIAEAAVRGRLASGAVVNFSPLEWTRVEAQPMNKYNVSGWGQVIGQNGMSMSFAYNAAITLSGGSWEIDALNVLPQ